MSKSKQKKKAAKTADGAKKICENRKAKFRFEILEAIECGIALVGSEVKSLRDGKVSLDEAYGRIKDKELWLVGCDINEYRQASIWNHEPKRPRKLLVHSIQLRKLSEKANEKGLTLVPLRLFFNERGLVKLDLGVARGKKMHDKRQSLKNADNKRRLDRILRGR